MNTCNCQTVTMIGKDKTRRKHYSERCTRPANYIVFWPQRPGMRPILACKQHAPEGAKPL